MLKNLIQKINENTPSKGKSIGRYIRPKLEIKYQRKTIIYTDTSKNAIIVSSRKNAFMKQRKNSGREGIYVNEKPLPMFNGYQRGIVYKPYISEQISDSDFVGPVEQFQNPQIEKITYKNIPIYFGAINNKFVIYTTYLDAKGKKQFKLHNSKKIDPKNNNSKNLKQYALKTLKNLKELEESKIKYNEEHNIPIHEIIWSSLEKNKMQIAA